MNSDGDGIFINMDEINKVKTVALESFTMEKFRHMCILSGCDYLPSIKGLGLYKAHKYLKRSTNVYKVSYFSSLHSLYKSLCFQLTFIGIQYHNLFSLIQPCRQSDLM